MTPGEDELLIDVRGDLAGILAISLNTKKPVTRAGSSQVEMVAGTSSDLNLRHSQVEVVARACSNLKLRTQKNRPDGAADVRVHGSQFEMVAGAGFAPIVG